MARILAYTSPARGHLFPLTPILIELQRRGHEVALRTLGAEVATMRGLGFDAEPIDPRLEGLPHDDWQARSARSALQRSVRTFCVRAEHDGDDLHAAITATRPDAVIVDVNTWGAMAAAERWGGPWAVFCPYPLPLRSRDVPPYGPGMRPARGPLGRLRDSLVRPLITGTVEKTMLGPLNGVRRTMGIEPLREVDDMFRRPPLLVYLTAEPFEYRRSDWPESVVMVGPCEWEPDSTAPEWLAQVDQPIVLVTTSSEFQDDRRLAETALDALTGEGFFVVVTLPAGDPARLRTERNARLERFVPHGPLLDRAACAVTHGGMGATQKALVRGVPVCVVPFGRDQFEVARRVEVSGAGTRLPARRLNGKRLLAAVNEAMRRVDGARRLAASFRSAGGPVAAADAVEARLLGADGMRRAG